ncbi:P-loop ATPase, Sll1717 family [Kitasatospora purpeofusca]|uniref:P-loop ATPase, Sll1717 family n=1 Tax=Kitasatospora purpeofusca TaxID=67352 RepID=UPI00380BFEE8
MGSEVRFAADLLKKSGVVDAVTWEGTPAGGRLIITTVLEAIDRSDICLFDITTLSQNVLFEVGYAFSRRKHVLLSVNTAHESGRLNWKALNIFSTSGCLFYENSGDLSRKFLTGLAGASERTLWDDVSEALGTYQRNSIFYVPTHQTSEAERDLRRIVLRQRDLGMSVKIADPGEQGTAPLAWYVNAVYSSSATLLQMGKRNDNRTVVNNARAAFLAGLARGLERPLLIVVEDGYNGPVDYKDLLYIYQGKRRLRERIETWLQGALSSDREAAQGQPERRSSPRLEIAAELKDLKFGEYVAENESETLDEYFVRTSEYESVLSSTSVVFVGRKGVGKSANMIRASQELKDDKRNLVCVIRPSTYELEGLVGVIESLGADGTQPFLIESFWKFLLYSEIAIAAVAAADSLPAGIKMGGPMAQLRDYLVANRISDEFSVRLERAVAEAQEKIAGSDGWGSIEQKRERISHILHANIVSELRRRLGEALSDRARVALLVDDLDTAWRATAELRSLGILLLGLLSCAGKVADEFRRQGNKLNSVNVTVAVFLRSDIYDEVIKEAREPDKINTMRINWSQRDLLTRVMDERYLSVRPEGTDPAELWTRFFCPTIEETPTLDYILSRILQRPRDFVFFCKAAVFNAANARHDRVEAGDIHEAEKSYSKFALDALVVEYGSTIPSLEDVAFEFAGSESIVTRSQAIEIIEGVSVVGPDGAVEMLEGLIKVSFFGVEVRDGEFSYPDRDADFRKARVLSRNTARRGQREERLQIHPAYRNYLDIAES